MGDQFTGEGAEPARLKDFAIGVIAEGKSDRQCYLLAQAVFPSLVPLFGSDNRGKDWFRRYRKSISPSAAPSDWATRTESWAGDTKTVTFTSDKPMTPEQYVARYKINLALWEITEFTCKVWDMGYKNAAHEGCKMEMYSICARIKPRKKEIEAATFLESLIVKVGTHAPSWAQTKVLPTSDSDCLLEMTIPDIHFGKLAWKPEAGDNYDLKIAEERFRSAVVGIAESVQWKRVKQILLPIGNDLLNCDGPSGTTTAGTPQSNDGRYQKAYLTVFENLIWAIDYLRFYSPVHILSVPGNHDATSSWTLCHAVKAWYSKCPDVSANIDPSPRKYHRFGEVLLGFTHGDKENVASLALIMATEMKKDWAETRFREWHTGHLHKLASRQQVVTGDESHGVRTRTLSSLSGDDPWHFGKGYIGNIKSAEAFLWHESQGLKQTFVYNV